LLEDNLISITRQGQTEGVLEERIQVLTCERLAVICAFKAWGWRPIETKIEAKRTVSIRAN
jgi:hypothetical protein